MFDVKKPCFVLSSVTIVNNAKNKIEILQYLNIWEQVPFCKKGACTENFLLLVSNSSVKLVYKKE